MKTYNTTRFLMGLIFSITLFQSCNGKTRIPVRVDCILTDSNSKPLADRQIDLFTTLNINDFNSDLNAKKQGTVTTNKDGKATLEYGWQNDESTTTYFHVVPKDDSIYKAVTYSPVPIPDYSEKKGVYNVKLEMDKVVPLKIRIKSKRNDVIRHDTKVYLKSFNGNYTKILPREFHRSDNTTNVARQIDEVLSVSTFENKTCVIETGFVYSTDSQRNNRIFEVNYRTLKDSVYLIEF